MFSSREHTRALSASDVWAVVGWSGDLLPLAERINDVVLVAPSSGTALWADVWAVPWQAQNGSKVLFITTLLDFQLDCVEDISWMSDSLQCWSCSVRVNDGVPRLLLHLHIKA